MIADHGRMRRYLLVAAGLGPVEFVPADLGAITVGLVEAVHRMIWMGLAEQVHHPGFRWTYRLTESGRREAARIRPARRRQER